MDAVRQEELSIMEQISALPDGERAEIIDGQMYMMAPPTTRHQLLVSMLTLEIGSYIKKHGGNCKVIPAPFAVFLEDEQQEQYVEPDISVICEPNKLDDKSSPDRHHQASLDDRGCHGAPDWVIEIVSPSSRKLDYGRKQALYLQCGVREYWIVDPLRETTVVYRAAEDWIPSITPFGESISVGIYEDLEITIE